jgi:hypothetical protein
VRIRVYPLPVADQSGLRLVRDALGRHDMASKALPRPPVPEKRAASFPVALVVVVALAALALALNEWLTVSLRWRTT